MRVEQRFGLGLTRVPTGELEQLLRLHYRGNLPLPLTRATMMAMGLNRLSVDAELLLGLDAPAFKAVLVAVIAERRRAEGR